MLEFPDGQIVLLTLLEEGQHATVLQLPAALVGAKVGPRLTAVERQQKASILRRSRPCR
jgi:hypothetical protein